jgi:hypothetical protein
MKRIPPMSLRRVALWLPACGLLLAPLVSQAREREETEQRDRRRDEQVQDIGLGGRAGIVEEFNFGPTGMDVIKQRQLRPDAGGTLLLSGRVVEMKGQTLYVERNGVVVPLDMRALRITRQPQKGQQIVASYAVNETNNVALSLAGEVAPPGAD